LFLHQGQQDRFNICNVYITGMYVHVCVCTCMYVCGTCSIVH